MWDSGGKHERRLHFNCTHALDRIECVGIFGKMWRRREQCVMVDCILWHELCHCSYLKIGVGAGEKCGKCKNDERKKDWKITE